MKDVFLPLIEKLFDIRPTLRTYEKPKRLKTWRFDIGSKPLYRYLTRIFDLPEGKKSGKLRVPEIIRSLNVKERIPYLAGLIDTYFGSIGKTIGITCAGPLLVSDLKTMLSELCIRSVGATYLKK